MEPISKGLETLDFDTASPKQMTSTWAYPKEENLQENLPLFLINLNKKEKSHEILKLRNPCCSNTAEAAYLVIINPYKPRHPVQLSSATPLSLVTIHHLLISNVLKPSTTPLPLPLKFRSPHYSSPSDFEIHYTSGYFIIAHSL